MENLVMNPEFWQGRRVFITGHTGFKGSWLSLWLSRLGANVTGYALAPNTNPNLYTLAAVDQKIHSHIGDICDYTKLAAAMHKAAPEIVIHMAAQALVRPSYQAPLETYQTNVMGTANVLEAARHASSTKTILVVSSDKCYENREWDWGYRENEALGGADPYSSSKACTEIVANAYRRSFFDAAGIGLATARAGNVIGGGDWSADRLIPDLIASIHADQPILIRYPQAIRPWQHVLEPLSGYLLLAQRLHTHGNEYANAWNFGPRDEDAKPVSWIADRFFSLWGKPNKWIHDNTPQPHEAHYLKLDTSLARNRLGWQPRLNLDTGLILTVAWAKAHADGLDMHTFTDRQIDDYQQHQLTHEPT